MSDILEYIVKTYRIPLSAIFYLYGCFNLWRGFENYEHSIRAGIARLIAGVLFVFLGLFFFLILGYWR